MDQWRIYTEAGGLSWVDVGPSRGAVGDALADCASTLSPRGEPPSLSTYWIDRVLDRLDDGDGEIAHGDLWILRRAGESIEFRMDVDDDGSDPIATVDLAALRHCLDALRAEVQARLATGHMLDGRHWSQKNPA